MRFPAENAPTNFIKTHLQLAQSYCELAKRSTGSRRAERLKYARRAYNKVLRFMLRAELRDDDFAYITANAERLKFALDELEAHSDEQD